MKKFIRISLLALLILLAFSLLSCEKAEDDRSGLSVVCTVFPQYDFTRNIARTTDINIKMLLPAGSEAHSYEPSPADMKAINDCDLFILVGGESEEWAKKMLASSELEAENVLLLMDVIDALPEEDGLSEHESEEADAETTEYDEHIWTSPKNAIKITEAISDRLCALMPENSEIYRKNTEEYVSKLSELDSGFEALARESGGKRLVVGDRFPFLYLVREYGFEYVSAFSGCAEQTEASLSVISELIEIVKTEGIQTVFAVDYSSGSLAETIADESGARVLRLYSCHTITQSELGSGEDYLSLMKKNLANIEKAVSN